MDPTNWSEGQDLTFLIVLTSEVCAGKKTQNGFNLSTWEAARSTILSAHKVYYNVSSLESRYVYLKNEYETYLSQQDRNTEKYIWNIPRPAASDKVWEVFIRKNPRRAEKYRFKVLSYFNLLYKLCGGILPTGEFAYPRQAPRPSMIKAEACSEIDESKRTASEAGRKRLAGSSTPDSEG
ncbi:hypothetical protein FPQ18DRAFT_390438 [Pyronema domesticum]|nr:hypothetical protein FPQ18DRAFT_390438 [Pyronema domesticum]